MDAKRFDFGYMTRNLGNNWELFLSVTPGFEYGPGIQRDGVTLPRMTDPRHIRYVCGGRGIEPRPGTASTIVADEQRLGTWTLYDHLKAFIDNNPGYRVAAVQSNGDLTMNPWHVAYIRESHIPKQPAPILCGLFTPGDPLECIKERTYRCLVKWREKTNQWPPYQFLQLKFSYADNEVKVKTKAGDDISQEIEFALSGKTIIKNGYPVPLARAVDKFDDLRHVFNLPEETTARGSLAGIPVNKVYFGEYQLYRNLNERRAALFGPVIVDLSIREKAGAVDLNRADVEKHLLDKRYHHEEQKISDPDQFRTYPDDENKIEIFFGRSVYPFGAIGIENQCSKNGEVRGQNVVSYLSGGISGRVGSTLEGVIDTLYSYLKCTEAMVLDEGMDCSLIVNPQQNGGSLTYDNRDLLDKVLCCTYDLKAKNSRQTDLLNKGIFEKIDKEYTALLARDGEPVDYADVFEVKPSRPQIRSVVILAVKKS